MHIRGWVLSGSTFVSVMMMGAHPALGSDCNTNGIDDAEDIAADESFDCNTDGLPDACRETDPSAKLVASDGQAGDGMGYSVAIGGGTIVVGSPSDDDNGSQSGSAYVFANNGGSWSEQAKLVPEDGAAFDNFGYSVAISGDTIVVGARRDHDMGFESGSVYVYVRNNASWEQQAKLVASDGEVGAYFGQAVAISDDAIAVGARLDGPSDPGAAYIFHRTGTTWSEQAKLVASDAEAGDQFGISVAISGNTAIIGAPFGDDGGMSSGAAYVFVGSGATWNEQAKLLASNGAPFALFGSSVGLSGDTAVIGAYGDAGAGAAYVFTRNGADWSEQQKLVADDAAQGDSFGSSVAIDDNTCVIGAASDDDGGAGAGSTYVFEQNEATWFQTAKLHALDAAAYDGFGFSVGLDDHMFVAGAFGDNDNGNDSGSAYAFADTSHDRDGDGAGDDCDGCPDDPAKTDAGVCGCGEPDSDTDADGVPDCHDNCQFTANAAQSDADGDGVGDDCDGCPDDPATVDAGDCMARDPPQEPEQASNDLPDDDDDAAAPDDHNRDFADLPVADNHDDAGDLAEAIPPAVAGCGAGACGVGLSGLWLSAIGLVTIRARRPRGPSAGAAVMSWHYSPMEETTEYDKVCQVSSAAADQDHRVLGR